MSLSKAFIAELKSETETTRKLLSRVPVDNLTWKPHEKSMTIERLAQHVAELPKWITNTVTKPGLNFAEGWTPSPKFASAEELVNHFDKNVVDAIAALETISDEDLNQPWTLQNGEQIYFTMPKKVVIRTMALNHFIHHRGQLSVYLRLLNIPIPGMYGPSADDKM
jgi:uncharacterized damage-inducible protein DinB